MTGDPMAPARGCAVGVVLGLLGWVVLAAAWRYLLPLLGL